MTPDDLTVSLLFIAAVTFAVLWRRAARARDAARLQLLNAHTDAAYQAGLAARNGGRR